jgi:putative salt-induced outer membrane protein YdiY
MPSPAAAQSEEPVAERRWQASAEFAYADQTGNRTLRVLTGGLKASHLQKDLFRLDLTLQSRYGESDESVVARSHYGSLAFDLSPSATWSPFLFGEAEHDRFKRLDARVSAGAGAKYTIYRGEETQTEASLSAALLLTHETFVPSLEDPAPPSRTVGRWSFRARGTQDLPAGARIHNTTFFQPLYDEMADYLLRSESSVRMSLTERLAFSVSYQWNRTSLPPEGVSPDDRILSTGLIFDF